ncbi:MAG TPA: hypothetical protein PKH79_04670 [Prolixibacteraceae bacterium]|nr:hypothetical protein [Prolixibacteraceae bacterium]
MVSILHLKSAKIKLYGVKSLVILTVLLFIGGTNLLAQQPVAAPGPNGNFVFFGRNIPVGFQYKLERKPATSDTEWKEIYRTNAFTLNYQSVVDRLLQAGSKSPVFEMPDSSTISRFISLLKGKRTTDSVYIFNSQPCYIEVMGTGFFDVTATPEIGYEYRVSEINKKGDVLKSVDIKANPFPGKVNFGKPVFKEYQLTSKSIILRFTLKEENALSNVRVIRQAIFQTPFSECFPSKFFNRGEDGLGATLIDSLVIPGVSYRYVVFPVDAMGNLGTPSDTVQITFDQGFIVPLEKFEVKKDSNFIVLNWRIPKQKNLRGISIYRSENFDDGYALLDRVPAIDSTYTDQQIKRGISYFYYLVFHGLTETSPPSAKVIGLVDEKEKPVLAPGSVKIEKTPQGNLLKWKRTEANTRGYFVFRGEGYTATEIQISSLLISDSVNVSFLDSVQNLIPGQTYCYAISSVNRGDLEGPKSKVVIAEPVKPELPTPLNLQVQMVNDKAMLFWDDISTMSDFITEYRVLRCEGDKATMDTLAMVRTSAFYDSTVVRGKEYHYFVQALGIQQSESALSVSASFLLPEILPVPPAGLRAARTSESVILHWDMPVVDELKSFKIYREKLGSDKKLIATVGSQTIDYTDQVTEKGTYFYTVTSITKSRESVPCDEIGVAIE